MKKYILTVYVILGVLAFPSLVFASWWNPFSWFGDNQANQSLISTSDSVNAPLSWWNPFSLFKQEQPNKKQKQTISNFQKEDQTTNKTSEIEQLQKKINEPTRRQNPISNSNINTEIKTPQQKIPVTSTTDSSIIKQVNSLATQIRHLNNQISEPPSVDIKVNGSDGSRTFPQQTSYTISWTSKGIVSPGCNISGLNELNGKVASSGSYTVKPTTISIPVTITIKCSALVDNMVTSNAVSDSVTVKFMSLQSITKLSVSALNLPIFLHPYGEEVKIASFRFSGFSDLDGIYSITGLTFSTANSDAFRNIILKSTNMSNLSGEFVNGTATFNDMSLFFQNSDKGIKIVDVYAIFNNGYSGKNIQITLDSYRATAPDGTKIENNSRATANVQYIYKSVPTIITQPLSAAHLYPGTNTLSKITISASPAGSIGWKKISWTITKTADLTLSSDFHLYDSSNSEVDGVFTATVDLSGSATNGLLTFVAFNEQEISSSESYALKTNVGGMVASGNYISTSIQSPSTYSEPNSFSSNDKATFVWTDRSIINHSLFTKDWNNDFKVVSLPTEAQTIYY